MIFIGIDDTDVVGAPGTGHLARLIAAELAAQTEAVAVVRHQLLEGDARVPMTAKNSSACLLVEGDTPPATLAETVRAIMRAHFVSGSDPGLAVGESIPPSVISFGQRAQRELLTQDEARALAARHHILLYGLGGTQDGVIGALAAVGLAASGADGRYIIVGAIRELSGVCSVETLQAAGIARVQTLDGAVIEQGLVLADKVRPARRDHRPVLIVAPGDDYWLPLKVN
ncbi:MAG: ABC transporter substrate-binding protein [Anaerolineales bacterium]